MAETLRIVVDNVVLEVNDKGETITLPLADERFIKRVIDYASSMQSGAEEMQRKSEEIEDTISIISADIEYHEMLKDGFNQTFGDRAYEKVFGEDVVIGIEYITQFIEQIMPYIEKYQKNRTAKLSKYSADRVGSM